MKFYNVNVEKMRKLTTDIFAGWGISREHAGDVADLLIDADLRGVRSHGVVRIRQYLNRCKSGGANKFPSLEEKILSPCTAVLDADGSLGAVSSARAVKLARTMAEESGMALVSVKNGNHLGMTGHWAISIAGDDMVGICGSTTSPCMAAPGGKTPVIGNNPIGVAYSGDKYREINWDIASSIVAVGKAMDLRAQNKPIPDGWFLDKDGNPTNDLDKMETVIPVGMHKGFGLAFVIETFATLLSGGVLSNKTNSQQFEPDKPELSSHFFGAIKISKFRDVAAFRADVDEYIGFIKSQPTSEGIDELKYPGEIEYKNKQVISKQGIYLSEKLIDEIAGCATEMGIEAPACAFMKENAAE